MHSMTGEALIGRCGDPSEVTLQIAPLELYSARESGTPICYLRRIMRAFWRKAALQVSDYLPTNIYDNLSLNQS